MTSILRRTLAAAATAATAGALLFAGAMPASANHDNVGHDAGPLADVRNGQDVSRVDGSQDAWVQVSAPAACDAAATRHVLKIVRVTATDPAQQPQADAWVGDNLYSPTGVGLPGPLTVQSARTWQQWADTYGQVLVPANYEFELRCQNNLGTVLYEKWSGGVTFDTPTHWTANALPDTRVATTTTVTASPNPATTAQTVTLTATVSESDAGAPTGDVEFKNGDTVLGAAAVDASGVAALTVGPLPAGAHPITAAYAGDTTFAGSTSDPLTVTVEQAPAAATSTTLAVDPVSGPAYQSVTLTGTVANSSDAAVIPTGTCAFLDGAATIGSAPVDASGTCTMTSAAFAAGAHAFKAVYNPSDPALFTGSESAVISATYDASAAEPDDQTIVVTVPAGQLTIHTPYTPEAPLNMGDMILAADGSSFSASAPFDDVTITDTRAGNPGWTASLIRADFVGAADTIPAQYSGFENVTPDYIPGNAIGAGDVAVQDVPANDPGYTPGPAEFASTTAGNGTGTVDIVADFVLEGVPTSTQAGLYTATVTFTVS